jgi:hypothetical protein
MQLTEILAFLKENHEVANAISAMTGAVIALLAFIISVLSVVFTWKALKHQRIHNSLSVRPLPYITVGDYENKLYVKIRNNGTGPLIIKALTVPGAEDPSIPLVNNMPTLLPGVVWTNFTGATSGRSVPAGGEMVLLELSDSSVGAQFQLSRDKVRETLGKLSLTLDYTDIYSNKLPLCSRDLKWFHRTLTNSIE